MRDEIDALRAAFTIPMRGNESVERLVDCARALEVYDSHEG